MSDLVKFYELERAELEDVAALQTLTLEYAQRVLGSLVGGDGLETMGGGGGRSSGGLVTLPSYTYDSNAGTITLSTFSYLETFRGGAAHSGYSSTNIEARIARYDSSAPWSGSVDVSAVTIINPSSLWARARRQSGDAQARRQWDTALSAEVPVTLETRELQQVELVVSVNRPEDSAAGEEELGQWVKIGDLSAALANPAIRIKWVSIWDTVRSWLQSPTPHAGSDEAQIALNAKSGLSEYADSGILPEIGGTRGLGLRDHLKMIRGQLQRVINQGASDTDQDTTKNWLSAPVLSLRNIAARLGVVETGLSDEITARESGQESLSAQISERPRIVAYGSIRYTRLDGASLGENDIALNLTPAADQYNLIGVTPALSGSYAQQRDRLQNIRIEFSPSLAGVKLLGMQAQINMTGLTSTSTPWAGLKTLTADLLGAFVPTEAFLFPQIRLWEGQRSYQSGSPSTNSVNDRAYSAGGVIDANDPAMIFRFEILTATEHQSSSGSPSHGAMIFDGAGAGGAPDLVNGHPALEYFDVLLTFWGIDP